jgi:hypothetical protein
MKNLTTLTIIFLFAFTFHAKAQTNKSTSTNQYAILKLNMSYGNYTLGLYLDNNKYLDLFKTLQLDTLKSIDDDYRYSSLYTLKGINFMDKEGYELVSSSMTSFAHGGTTREFIFRKKIAAK